MNSGTKNNNWLNIEYHSANKWLGQVGAAGRFCIFDNVIHGLRAGIKILESYLREGHDTIEKIITKYAPPIENDTDRYIAHVCEWSGLRADTPLTSLDLPRIVQAMAREETGNIVSDAQINEAWKEV
jgi:hypothetical protein